MIGEASAGEIPAAVAIVSRDENMRHVLIEVGRRREGRSSWLSRELAFEPQDELIERLRTIGLTIATLVGDVEEQEAVQSGSETPVESETTEAPSAVRSQPAPAPPKQATRPPSSGQAPVGDARGPSNLQTSVAVGALLGTAFDDGPPRFGAFARGGLRFDDFAAWPVVSSSYAQRFDADDGLTVRWLTFGVGAAAGHQWSGLELAIRGRLEGVLERLGVEQTRTPTDAGSVWQPGVRLGLELAWPAGGDAAMVGSLDGVLFRRATRITVAERVVARAPASALHASFGAELRF